MRKGYANHRPNENLTATPRGALNAVRIDRQPVVAEPHAPRAANSKGAQRNSATDVAPPSYAARKDKRRSPALYHRLVFVFPERELPLSLNLPG